MEVSNAMASESERAAQARSIIDDSNYMVLGTADAEGRPWATPVWFAVDSYRTFYWVSSHEARHSRNIGERPAIGIVIFDSSVLIGAGQGVYMEAEAEQLAEGADLDRALAVFSDRSLERGGRAWTRSDVADDGLIRVYRARASSHSMLAKDGQPDHRLQVDITA